MSYDISVFGARSLTDDQVENIVGAIPDLEIGDMSSGEFTVVRGERRAYAFTVFGPDPVEESDVPDDVSALVPNPRTSWQVVIEGSAAAQIVAARRFAEDLAVHAAGVALDQQTSELIGHPTSTTAPTAPRVTPPAYQRVSQLVLHWYSPPSDVDVPDLWVELAQRHFPEAVPRRFGPWEPFKYNFARDGTPALKKAYARGLRFSASPPCMDGAFHPSAGNDFAWETLTMLADPVEDPQRRASVRRFFTEFAQRRASLLAIGEIRRDIWFRDIAETGHTPGDRGGHIGYGDRLVGLPRYRVWWTWFGPDYVPHVAEYLPAEHTEYRDGAALYIPTESPADRRELAVGPDPFPAELRAVPMPPEPGQAMRGGPVTPRNAPGPWHPTLVTVDGGHRIEFGRPFEHTPLAAEPDSADDDYQDVIRRELDAAGIWPNSVGGLVNSSVDTPEVVAIMADWLQHIDERVPDADDRKRLRAGLLRNLISRHTRGNRVITDLLFAQFDIDPPLSDLELEAAMFAMAKAVTKADLERVAQHIRRHERHAAALVRWLGGVRSELATELAVQALANPGLRNFAMGALARQRAPGVRAAVAQYLDNPHWHRVAARTLTKLPPE